ncbi:DUF3995 domain-containing protein [Siminovitchia acidinfaciens]|uniref:DUF3995 domain-containing protein n=1 Tax=Siminovitchia acidinfaciens TaxID=2321395 RepID=A0A429Y461_9BACI|nr:DUF3995 domain-containing protein [Siminovitchia acidinfaciens]RST76139.1 DUF3995 domain-containing protein [Siminovitchia acidinfaciens]
MNSNLSSKPLQLKSTNWAGGAVFVWSIAYMLPHLYWALGGRMGLFLLKPGVAASSQFELINWISLPFFIVAGFVGLGFIYLSKNKILHLLLLSISVFGCSIATSHGIFGIIYRGLQIAGVIGLENRTFDIHDDMYVVWDMVIFEPWFLIEGILLATAGWFSLKEARSRKVWLAVCMLGTIVGLVTGMLGVRFA